MGWLSAIGAFLKALSVALGLIQQNRDQTTGVDLQRGADAEKAYHDLTKAMAARDAVQPLDSTGRLPDGSRDPNDRG